MSGEEGESDFLSDLSDSGSEFRVESGSSYLDDSDFDVEIVQQRQSSSSEAETPRQRYK